MTMVRSLCLILVFWFSACSGFVVVPQQRGLLTIASASTHRMPHCTTLRAANDGESSSEDQVVSSSKKSLEEKMKAWEATEEEVKAATLGGMVPGRSDAFDVGLYIAFPLMVLSGLAFAAFPLIMGNLDVDSVGPPPTV